MDVGYPQSAAQLTAAPPMEEGMLTLSDNDARGYSAQRAAEVARMHYTKGMSKTEIAEALHISRFKVARLLDKARAEGVVTFSVTERPREQDRLAATLMSRLPLQDCVVVQSDDPSIGHRRVAAAAASRLSEELTRDDVLGMSWGRTLSTMSRCFHVLPPLTTVQLTGSLADNLPISPIEVVRQTSRSTGGKALPIIAPILADTASAANTIRQQTDVKRAFDAFDSLTVAVLSVGSWQPRTSQLVDLLDPETQERMEELGVEGEVGATFLDARGHVIDDPTLDRFIRIDADQLRRVPKSVVVAHGAAKAGTVLAAVRAGLANTLFIDVDLARHLARLTQEPAS